MTASCLLLCNVEVKEAVKYTRLLQTANIKLYGCHRMEGRRKGISLITILFLVVFLAEHSLAASLAPAELRASAETKEPHGVKSAVLKKALRSLASMLRSSKLDWVLKRLADISNDTRVVKVVRKHARTIADKLDELAKWEEISLTIIQDQVAGALYDVGVARSTARKIGFWIKNFISWVLL